MCTCVPGDLSAATEVGPGVSGACVSAVGGTRETRACVHYVEVCMSVCHHWCASSWTSWQVG